MDDATLKPADILLNETEPEGYTAEPRIISAEVAKLTAAVSALIEVNRALLKKLEDQAVMLGALAKFVRENSPERASFGVI
jgi:hypothetical protein